jgi:hypothetical protein
MTRALTSSAWGVCLLLVACSGDETSVPVRRLRDASVEHAVVDTGRADTGEFPDFTQIRCEPTLASLEQNVFGVACGYDSCHGDNNPAWGLYLTVGGVADLLIDQPASGCQGWTRVVSGSPERSLFWRKLDDAVPPCGEAMPLGLGRLPAPVLECIRGWIVSLGSHDAGRGD